MCGICGVLSQAAEPGEALLNAMLARIASRGPDHTGIHCGDGVALGMNRLAILDLKRGNQPMFAENGRYCIVYNGEIYNHKDIREDLMRLGETFNTDCDTETLLKAYCRFGPDFLPRLNGMFAFAVWDAVKRTLFLARDGFGIKPLYTCRCGDAFAFASQPSGLLPVTGRCAPDWHAIATYFFLGYVPYDTCAFEGINKFPPGHYAYVTDNSFDLHRFFIPEYGVDIQGHDYAHQLSERIRAAVRRELLSDVPLGLFLSGGLDSSAVALYAAQESDVALTSYALSFAEKTHDESQDALTVAKALGLKHKTLDFGGRLLREYFKKAGQVLDEPFADATAVPLLALSDFARQDVKVVLTGWGGDEIMAGYPTVRAHTLAARYKRLPGRLRQSVIPALINRLPVSDRYMSFEFKAKRFIKGMDQQPEVQHLLWMSYFDFRELGRLFLPTAADELRVEAMAFAGRCVSAGTGGSLLDRILAMEARTFLEGNGLFQVDRMSMSASLEARVPLLNRDLAAWVNGLPAQVKAPGGRPKALMRSALHNCLPRRIIEKPKKGFGPPISIWTRGVLAPEMQRLLSPDSLAIHGVFDTQYVQNLIREHLERKQDHGRKLWALISFQLWHQNFVGQCG